MCSQEVSSVVLYGMRVESCLGAIRVLRANRHLRSSVWGQPVAGEAAICVNGVRCVVGRVVFLRR